MMPLFKHFAFLYLAVTLAVIPLVSYAAPAHAASPSLPATDNASAPQARPQTDEFAPEALDNFGYQDTAQVLSLVYAPNDPWWVDPSPTGNGITRPVTFTLPVLDDAISVPITIGPDQNTPGLVRSETDPTRYPFPFYDGLYDSLYVSMNGMIRFTDSTDSDNKNYPLPTGDLSPSVPTNFIAAVWANLDANDPTSANYNPALPTTQVFATYLGPGEPFKGSFSAFVITWENIYRRETSDMFTFQVVLKDDGDIYVNLLLLPVLSGDLTIGIEDSSGDDGLLHHYNGGGNPIQNSWSVQFERPSPDYRMRVYPALQGAFAIDRYASFDFKIKNTTEIEGTIENTDIYDLSVAGFNLDAVSRTYSNPAGWTVRFFTSGAKAPLGDTNGNFMPDTGTLGLGEEASVLARVTTPLSAVAGDEITLDIDVISFKGSGLVRDISLSVVVPSGHANTYSDGTGTYLGLVWPKTNFAERVAGFSGDNLVVEDWLDGFIYAWSENNPVNGYSYIHYAFMNRLGFILKEGVVNHSTGVSDIQPALGVDYSTGKAGLVWLRDNGIVWGAVLDPADLDGIVGAPFLLANSGEHTFSSPAVAHQRGSNAQFTAAWVEQNIAFGTKEMKARVFGSAGPTQSPALLLFASNTQTIYGLTMESLAAPNAGSTFLVYCDTLGGDPQISWMRLSATGIGQGVNLISAGVSLGATPSADIVKNNNIFLAWIDSGVTTPSGFPVQGISYIVFSASLAPSVVQSMYSPNLGNADYIAVTADNTGNAVLLWMDSDTYRYQFYALVNPGDPTVPLTPASLVQTLPSGSTLSMSGNGQSLATYDGRHANYLPLIRK